MATHEDPDGGRADLGALGAGDTPQRLDALVQRVMAAAGPELARRRLRRSAWSQIAGWQRPLLAAAGLAAVLVGAFLMSGPPAAGNATSLAEAAGVPSEWVPWTTADRNPTPGELLDLRE